MQLFVDYKFNPVGSDMSQNQQPRGTTVIWTQNYTGFEAADKKEVIDFKQLKMDTYVIRCNKDNRIDRFGWIADPSLTDEQIGQVLDPSHLCPTPVTLLTHELGPNNSFVDS